MARSWVKGLDWTDVVLDVENPWCGDCGGRMHVRKHEHHRIFTFDGPVHLIYKRVHCVDRACAKHARLIAPETILKWTMPRWLIGWDVFCWLGHRRFARHWSVPQLRLELLDSYGIVLSDDAIEGYLQRYQCMLAARQQDLERLKEEYRSTRSVLLSIDGLQPEKGHETLYVVRELRQQRVWFAEALLSSTSDEIRRLVARARKWAGELGRPVRLWMSDKQDAVVKTIAQEFPATPHRYCANHFLRDMAKPLLELDSHAKVQMRRKIRGLRSIEREVMKLQRPHETGAHEQRESSPKLALAANELPVVLDYCAAIRGILNDSQGGPLHPPGLRMAEALNEVRRSLRRNVQLKKSAGPHRSSAA